MSCEERKIGEKRESDVAMSKFTVTLRSLSKVSCCFLNTGLCCRQRIVEGNWLKINFPFQFQFSRLEFLGIRLCDFLQFPFYSFVSVSLLRP